ncbi:DUF308 domain-containing protein [Pseudonocardia sp.]|uniref:DUF308 domain-containing protein n=1 Tax=Pseudonocardia sp. TaxID=60912 RepID=UPI00260D435B|nr:DUF308 domain-containing protein [Pseudonocardia sp.]
MSTTTSTTPDPPDPEFAGTGSTGGAASGDTPPAARTAKHVAAPTAGRTTAETASVERSGWWVLLLLGVLTVFYGLLVMSLRPAALASVVVFAGIGFIVSGVAQFLIAGGIDGGWRWVAYAGGALGIVAGVAAFVWPGPTLYVLAVITAWAFVVSGLTRIVGTLLGSRAGLWWLGLVLGLFELLLGMWAIGSPLREVLLFVNLIGIFLIVSGVDAIVVAATKRPGSRADAAAA